MNNKYIWSDGWWIEDSEAWFVDGERNILLKLNTRTNECSFIASIPDGKQNRFRLNPKCLKIENDIYCMPDTGDYIWIYQLEKREFKKIKVNNPKKGRLVINNFWLHGKKIFAVSIGLRQIIEIDTDKKCIVNYYDLDGNISESILISDNIFCVSSETNIVYQFDLKEMKCIVHRINIDSNGFRTICFDGEKIWLAGYKKEIYIWDYMKNTVQIINNFPENFCIYEKNENHDFLNQDFQESNMPIFLCSVFSGDNIWFIPFQTNLILYVNKNNYVVNVFDIENEDETRKSLFGRELCHKYLFEFFLDNRYIGLFSLKNNYYLQIDTFEKKYIKKEFSYSEQYMSNMEDFFFNATMQFKEINVVDKYFYGLMMKGTDKNSLNCKNKSIGKKVFLSSLE